MECPVCMEECFYNYKLGVFSGCPNGCDIGLDETLTPTESICLECPRRLECIMACPEYDKWVKEQRDKLPADIQRRIYDDSPDTPKPDPRPVTVRLKLQKKERKKPAPGTILAKIKGAKYSDQERFENVVLNKLNNIIQFQCLDHQELEVFIRVKKVKN